MELKDGTILIKNSITNNYTKQFNMSKGDKFKFIAMGSIVAKTFNVIDMRNGRSYIMYAYHFKDSNGEFIEECMWR